MNEHSQPLITNTYTVSSHTYVCVCLCMCKCMHKDEWYPNEYLERFAVSVCIYQLCWFLVFRELLTKESISYFTKESLLSFYFSLPLYLIPIARSPATTRCLHSCFKVNFPFKCNTFTHASLHIIYIHRGYYIIIFIRQAHKNSN